MNVFQSCLKQTLAINRFKNCLFALVKLTLFKFITFTLDIYKTRIRYFLKEIF